LSQSINQRQAIKQAQNAVQQQHSQMEIVQHRNKTLEIIIIPSNAVRWRTKTLSASKQNKQTKGIGLKGSSMQSSAKQSRWEQ